MTRNFYDEAYNNTTQGSSLTIGVAAVGAAFVFPYLPVAGAAVFVGGVGYGLYREWIKGAQQDFLTQSEHREEIAAPFLPPERLEKYIRFYAPGSTVRDRLMRVIWEIQTADANGVKCEPHAWALFLAYQKDPEAVLKAFPEPRCLTAPPSRRPPAFTESVFNPALLPSPPPAREGAFDLSEPEVSDWEDSNEELEEEPPGRTEDNEATQLAQRMKDYLDRENISYYSVNVRHAPQILRLLVKPLGTQADTALLKLKPAILRRNLRVDADPEKSIDGEYHAFDVPRQNREFPKLDAHLDSIPPLSVSIGLNTRNEFVSHKLKDLVHLLVFGATGSGKSVTVLQVIVGLCYGTSPDLLKLLYVDPHGVTLGRSANWDKLPHISEPLVDPSGYRADALPNSVIRSGNKTELLKVLAAATDLFQSRLAHLEQHSKTNIYQWNESNPNNPFKLVFVGIDEIAGYCGNKNGEPTMDEDLAQMLSAAAAEWRKGGIFLMPVTQFPRKSVLPFRSNIPSWLGLRSEKIGSRMIVNDDRLVSVRGKGDGYLLATGSVEPERVQTLYADENEQERYVERIAERWGVRVSSPKVRVSSPKVQEEPRTVQNAPEPRELVEPDAEPEVREAKSDNDWIPDFCPIDVRNGIPNDLRDELAEAISQAKARRKTKSWICGGSGERGRIFDATKGSSPCYSEGSKFYDEVIASDMAYYQQLQEWKKNDS